jgi:hypothetical protein
MNVEVTSRSWYTLFGRRHVKKVLITADRGRHQRVCQPYLQTSDQRVRPKTPEDTRGVSLDAGHLLRHQKTPEDTRGVSFCFCVSVCLSLLRRIASIYTSEGKVPQRSCRESVSTHQKIIFIFSLFQLRPAPMTT